MKTNAQLNEKILRALQKNARISVEELADRLQLTTAEISELIRKMQEDGTILGYYTLVNEEKLSRQQVRAMIEVEVQPQRDGGFDHVASAISRFPEVKTVYLVSGRYDLRLEVIGKSLQEVAFFVSSKLAPIEGVKATVTHFLLKKYKESGFRLHEEETYERLKIVP